MTEDELEDEEIIENGIAVLVAAGPHEDPRAGPASVVARALLIEPAEAELLIREWETDGRIRIKQFEANVKIDGQSVAVNRGLEWERVE